MQHLLHQLISLQRASHLSDRAFARTLGVSPALWSKTRAGRLPLGYRVLRGAARTYPHLKDAILSHLSHSEFIDQGETHP
jgi:hypothetical protein